jgi:Clp amino terminal domain, pathogenicity island component
MEGWKSRSLSDVTVTLAADGTTGIQLSDTDRPADSLQAAAKRLLKIGADEATRLGQHWMGPEHTLLGILRGDPDDLARRALEQAGVDASMVEAWITPMDSGAGEESTGVKPNPRWYTIEGRAEGMAAALGAAEPGTVHFLLALLWDQRRWNLTEAPGISRKAIVTALTERGATLPAAPLPELERKLNFTQHVEFPRNKSSEVLQLLAERHPPGRGPTFGFNYKDEEVAWVRAENGIDLQGIVDEAIASETND